MSEDQRRFRRFEYETEVSLTDESQFFTGFMKNISAGGLFVATHEVGEVGDRVRVKFTIAEMGKSFDVEGEVRWVRPYRSDLPEQIPGMGVRFLNLTEEQSKVINAYIAGRDTIFYDDDDDDDL